MVDIHSHILPGVDDGASSWAIAIDMVAAAAKDGICHIVATQEQSLRSSPRAADHADSCFGERNCSADAVAA